MEKFIKGRAAEVKAFSYLEKNCGYILLKQNFKWKRGEADLICEDSTGAIVLIEVRSSKEKSSYLRFSIGPRKLYHLRQTLEIFIYKNFIYRSRPRRIEIVWIEGEVVEHMRNPL